MAIQVTKRPYEFSFSGNPVLYELYSAQAAANSSIFFEVKLRFAPMGGAFTDVVSVPYSPTEGYAKINLQDLLHSQLKNELPTFSTDETAIHAAPAQSGRYYIEYREITAANPEPSWDASEKDMERLVVWGGIDYFRFRANNFWVNYYNSVSPDTAENPFFTWQLSGRMAPLSERMYLLWFNTTSLPASSLQVRVTVTYTDGTTAQVNKDFPSAVRGVGYFIPSGAEQWGLPALSTKDIWYWTVQVRNTAAGVPVSVAFKYEGDNRNDYKGITLHYRNSLNGLDSIRITGVVEKNLTYSFTEQARTAEPDYYNGHYITPQSEVVDVRERQPYKGDIGHLGREEQDRLRDAQLIRQVWMVKWNRWIPVKILTAQFNQESSLSSRWTMPIEFELAYEGGRFYTPGSVELGDAVFESNVCQARLTGITISAAVAPGLSEVTINATEEDPQVASTSFRYRVLYSDGTVRWPWETLTYSQLPIIVELESDLTFTLELQSICLNNVMGVKTTSLIDTRTATGGSGGGAGGGSSTANSLIRNNTFMGTEFSLNIAGLELVDNYVGAYSSLGVTSPNHTNIEVMMILRELSPSSVVLVSNGVTYEGAIEYDPNFDIWVVRFTGVTISGGFTIDID